MKKFLALSFLLLLVVSCRKQPQGAWTVETIPDPKKSPSKIFLSDPDTLISAETKSAINNICWDIEQQTSVQFGIVIVKSIGSEVPKTFATELFNHWGIGKSGKENGLLLLVVLDQKRWEFETGYGLEGELTDYDCSRIGESQLVPYFKLNNYEAGLLNAAYAVKSHLFARANIQSTTDSAFTAQAYSNAFKNYIDTDALGISEPPAPVAWGTLFWALVFPTLLICIFWAYLAYGKSGEKRRTKNAARKPSVVVFAFFSLLAPITYAALYSTNSNVYTEWMIVAAVYATFMFLITDYRIRRNKHILNSGQDVYLVYSDFRTSHSMWTLFMPVLFPIFYIPYLFWYYSRCSEMRKRSRPCKKCGNELHYKENVISELEDDKYLNKGQIKEEYLTSRDWDVWLCRSCSQTEVLGYKAYFTSYDTCPSCKFITEKYLGSQTITPATYESSGTGKKMYECKNCGNYREVMYTIPQKTRSSSSGGGGGGGGGSSWGGGRSGGGGAGGGW